MGGRKWDETQDRFRNVGIIAAIALLIFACNFFNGHELHDFVAIDTSVAMQRSLIIAGIHTHVLDVVCLLASAAEVFDHFVVSVIERLSGRDQLAEILSELLVVSDAVHASGVHRIGFWVGPFGARHDMRCGSTAVEVKTTRSHTGHRVTIHGEDQLLAPEQGVSVRPGVRVRKNDLGSRPTQRAAFPKAFVDVLDGDVIHEGNGRDQGWFRNRREARFHGRKGMFSYPPGKQPGVQQADSQVRIGLTQ